MSDSIHLSPEQCLKQETLFLVIVKEDGTWVSGRREPKGSIVKYDLRPMGHRNHGFTYWTDEYREATQLDKLMVISGKCDVIIWRK